MLTSWVGADDGATRSDTDFNNDSASYNSIDSDEASKLLFEEDARSSTDRSARPWRLSIERYERVIEEETHAPAPDPAPEASEGEFIKLGFGSSKKSKKKSKIFAARAVFEED